MKSVQSQQGKRISKYFFVTRTIKQNVMLNINTNLIRSIVFKDRRYFLESFLQYSQLFWRKYTTLKAVSYNLKFFYINYEKLWTQNF